MSGDDRIVGCEPLARYSEANARLTVQRRNFKDGQLTHMAVGCGDHWHVIEKQERRERSWEDQVLILVSLLPDNLAAEEAYFYRHQLVEIVQTIKAALDPPTSQPND